MQAVRQPLRQDVTACVALSATMPTVTPVTMSVERYLMGLPIYPPVRVMRSPLYSFLNDLDVPFPKNEAKRVLGKTEVEQKISGCFRTVEGAENFCILRTVIETARKQGRDILQTLKTAPDQLFLML